MTRWQDDEREQSARYRKADLQFKKQDCALSGRDVIRIVAHSHRSPSSAICLARCIPPVDDPTMKVNCDAFARASANVVGGMRPR